MNISGKLLGEHSAPIENASVRIFENGGEISKDRSDSQGVFACQIAEVYMDRELELSIEAPGFSLFRKDVRCIDNTDLGDVVLSGEAGSPKPRILGKAWRWLLAGGAVAPLLLLSLLKPSFNVILTDVGTDKIAIIKVVNDVRHHLTASRDFVEHPPTTVWTGVDRKEAEKIQRKFMNAGATVRIEKSVSIASFKFRIPRWWPT